MVLAADVPPSPVGFFPFTLQIPPLTNLPSAAQAQPRSSPFVPRTAAGGLTPQFMGESGFTVQWHSSASKKKITREVAWLLNGSRSVMVEKGNGKHGNTGRAKEEVYEKEIAANPALSPRASPETLVTLSLPHSISHAAGPCTGISKRVGKSLSRLLLLEVPRGKAFAQRQFASHPSALEVIWCKEGQV